MQKDTKPITEGPRKKKMRLETQYGLCLPVAFINKELRPYCGDSKWTLKAKVATTAVVEAFLADWLINAVGDLPEKQSTITPEVLQRAILQDSTFKRKYKRSTFNVFKDKVPKIVVKDSDSEKNKKRSAEEPAARPKRTRSTTVESQS